MPAEIDPNENDVVKTAVNETLLAKLGYGSPHEALGKHFHFGGLSGDAEIVGVIKNFNTLSLHEEIPAVMISQFAPWYSEVDIKIPAGSDVAEVIEQVAVGWRNVFPGTPFEFRFLDDKVDASYRAEQRLATLFAGLAFVAISISCLGLWALATYAAQQRRKEVGIRKILGANTSDLLVLLTGNLMIMVAIGFAISIPVSWILINRWLEEFAFHIQVGWGPFVITAITLALLLLISVVWHTAKALVTNPVESLKG